MGNLPCVLVLRRVW